MQQNIYTGGQGTRHRDVPLKAETLIALAVVSSADQRLRSRQVLYWVRVPVLTGRSRIFRLSAMFCRGGRSPQHDDCWRRPGGERPRSVIRFRTDRDTAWPDRNRQHSAEGRRRTRPAWPRTGHRPAPPQTRHGSAKCGQVIQHQRMLWTRDRMDMGHRTAMTGNDYFFARFSATMSRRSSRERAVYVPERRSKSSPPVPEAMPPRSRGGRARSRRSAHRSRHH
jgi:hypothetical protein